MSVTIQPESDSSSPLPAEEQRPAQEQEFAGRDIAAILWRSKFTITWITLFITAVVTVLAFVLPAKYDAMVLVLPGSDQDSPDRLAGLGGAVSQLGGIASLAGLSASGGTFKVEAVATLESEALTERYIEQANLLPLLFPSKWDSARHRWKSDDPEDYPTLWKANRLFRERIRTVAENAKTGLVTMTISWRDPKLAAKWANDLVALTNETLRKKAIEESERNIAFLTEQARQNNVLSVQGAIASLTEAQLRKVMIARGRDQYALKVLDPARVPEKQSFPQPAIWIPAAFFIGLFVGIFVVLMRASGDTSSPLAGSKPI